MAISFCGKRIVLTRYVIYKTQKRKNGYIILLPEIGEDLPNKDPLLKANGFPEFNTFSIERAIAAVGKLSVLFEQGIQKIDDNIEGKSDVDVVNDVINPIEELNLPFETTWGISKALYFGNQSLMPTKCYQNIHNRMVKARAVKHLSRPIYKACKEALESNCEKLTLEQQRIIEKYVIEGQFNGLSVEKQKEKEKLYYLDMQIFKKSEMIREKIEIATSMFKSTITNPNIVQDFPEDFLRLLSPDPKNPTQGPWKVTLEANIVSRFLEYCPDRDLRKMVWTANVQRGAMVGENTLRTSSDLEDIRNHKIERAKLLGYKSFSHMCMETKMAGSLQNIYRVMDNLLANARPAQEREFKELTRFARDRGFDGTIIRQWDVDYWMREYRRIVLNFKDEIFHEYFPLPHVLNGLFRLIENLFDVRITEGRKTDVWHTDVRFFDIIDPTSTDSEPIAHFYLDPYARGNNKMTKAQYGSWMVGIRNRSKIVSTTPLTALIFNFRPPLGDVPSLLSFKDVVNLFSEVGKSLQHLLTRVDYSELAGSSYVEWDAVNVSSYFMENWLYEPHIIRSIATHYKTNESMPEEQIDSIKNIRSHMAGYNLCRELYYGRFDLQLHSSDEFWVPMMKRLWQQHFVMPFDKSDSHVTSWTDVFGGHWAAACYSSLWSQMLAADVYSAFQELPKDDSIQMKQTAMKFRDTFLSLGGSVPASEVFERFRGRDPNCQALLKNLCLEESITNGSERI